MGKLVGVDFSTSLSMAACIRNFLGIGSGGGLVFDLLQPVVLMTLFQQYRYDYKNITEGSVDLFK